jgi:hypothetical protein
MTTSSLDAMFRMSSNYGQKVFDILSDLKKRDKITPREFCNDIGIGFQNERNMYDLISSYQILYQMTDLRMYL